MQILNTSAIASGYVDHNLRGGNALKVLSKFFFLLSLQKHVRNFFLVLEKKTKRLSEKM